MTNRLIDKYRHSADGIVRAIKIHPDMNIEKSKSNYWFKLDNDNRLATNEKTSLYQYLLDEINKI